MTTFNAKCPACDGPIHITGFSVRSCDVQIKDTGWAVMATIRNTGGTEEFTCPKCLVSVPPLYVYKEMTQKEAVSFMNKWSGNVFSIHNRMPLPPPERMEDEIKKALAETPDDELEGSPERTRDAGPGVPEAEEVREASDPVRREADAVAGA